MSRMTSLVPPPKRKIGESRKLNSARPSKGACSPEAAESPPETTGEVTPPQSDLEGSERDPFTDSEEDLAVLAPGLTAGPAVVDVPAEGELLPRVEAFVEGPAEQGLGGLAIHAAHLLPRFRPLR